MRIVHTCLRYPPALGGAETYIRNIVEQTRNVEANYDARVLTSKLQNHTPITELDPELLVDDPIYIQRLFHSTTPFISYPRLQALTYYIGHHKPDVIHGYGFWYQPADTSARYARRHHIPFIFHPLYYENDTRQKVVWQVYKHTIGRRTFEAADVVVTISPYEQSLIQKAQFPVKRFELIPPGIDIDRFNQPRLNPFLKRKINGKILFAACRISPGKGLNDVVDALPAILKIYPNTHFCIAGEDFGAVADLKSQASSLGIIRAIHFLGRLSDAELAAAYQHADVFVHPTHYEAFGIAMAEALAAGTPVVARRTAAVPFVVSDKRSGLLFNNQKELTEALLTLLSNQMLRNKMGQAGRQYVKDNFAWEIIIKKLTDLYTTIGQSHFSSFSSYRQKETN